MCTRRVAVRCGCAGSEDKHRQTGCTPCTMGLGTWCGVVSLPIGHVAGHVCSRQGLSLLPTGCIADAETVLHSFGAVQVIRRGIAWTYARGRPAPRLRHSVQQTRPHLCHSIQQLAPTFVIPFSSMSSTASRTMLSACSMRCCASSPARMPCNMQWRHRTQREALAKLNTTSKISRVVVMVVVRWLNLCFHMTQGGEGSCVENSLLEGCCIWCRSFFMLYLV